MPLINSINILAFEFAKNIASPLLNVLMHYLTESYLIIIPAIALYLYFRRDKNVFSLVIFGIVLYIVSDIIKLIAREPRPCTMPDLSWINSIGCETSFSFPSNHATVLTGLYLFTSSYKYLRILYIVWLVLILFSRVYLGLHYLTDIIAGIVISIAIAWPLYKYYSKKLNNFSSIIFCKLLRPLCPKQWVN
ncbi:MAG: phosphatase PAP2 family protein [Candidatus Micrarchaeia archaeon]